MTTITITTTSTTLHLRYNYNYNQNCNYNSNVTISTTSTALQLELQHTLQLQLQIKFFCTSLHHTTSCSCGWGDHCNHSKNHNHLSVHQWIRSAIHASQQLTSPIVSYLWSFRHRLVRHHWYVLCMTKLFRIYDWTYSLKFTQGQNHEQLRLFTWMSGSENPQSR